MKENPLQEILQALRNDSSTSTSQPFSPTKSSLAVNTLWFGSLCLTLFSALSAVLAKGWLAKYIPATPGESSSDACERHLRAMRAGQWRLSAIVAAIPFLIQMALFLFFIGLVILTLNDNFGIGLSVLILILLATALYILTTILPWFSPACPFQTTISDFIPGVAGKGLYKDSAATEQRPAGPPSKPIFETFSAGWRAIVDFLRQAHRKPEQAELEADMLAWVVTKSTNDDTIEEAVRAIAGAEPSILLRDSLHRSGVSAVFCQRFSQCFKRVPGLGISVADVSRAEAYIYAMLQLVQPFHQSEDPIQLSPLLSLLTLGQPLHRWDDFKPCLQALVCALRIGILLGKGEDDNTDQWERTKKSLTEMAGMGSMPYVRRLLVTAAVQGLLLGGTNLRRQCGLILSKQFQIGELTSCDWEQHSDHNSADCRKTVGESDDIQCKFSYLFALNKHSGCPNLIATQRW